MAKSYLYHKETRECSSILNENKMNLKRAHVIAPFCIFLSSLHPRSPLILSGLLILLTLTTYASYMTKLKPCRIHFVFVL